MECSARNGTSVSPPLPEVLGLVLEMEKEESSEIDVREKNQSRNSVFQTRQGMLVSR